MDTNWWGINRARMDLKSGKIPLETAREVERQGTERLAALKARAAKAPPMVYADEIGEGEENLQRLRAAIFEADTLVVCIFRRPARNVGTARLPHLAVVRMGQVPFIELDGRQRVRDWWGLLVDGVKMAEGPKRWVLKNAQGAALMDPFGMVDPRHLLTGRARMKATYRRRRDARRLERARARAREATRRTGDLHLVGADVRLKLMIGDREITRFNAADAVWRVGVDFATKPAAG